LDKGWYGQGVYFTSSARYAIPYFATKANPVIIVAYVIPGNIFPIVEHPQWQGTFVGKAIVPGHQSHYVATTISGFPIEKP